MHTQILRSLYLWAGLLMLSLGAKAQSLSLYDRSLSPEAVMSILVASPSSEEVYTYYGHAGYRVQDASSGLDLTFNYGIFSFSEDFLYRFVEGKTDYMVVPQPTQAYMAEYLGRGSEVVELSLRLDSLERAKVWAYLLENIRPEHRQYRYQFFTDNCATRPLAIVEMATKGLHYEEAKVKGKTWREEINDLEASSPWLVLGTDLALGSPCDEEMRARDEAFSPRLLVDLLKGAKRSDGSPIVAELIRHQPWVQAEARGEGAIPMPLMLFSLVALVLIYIYGYHMLYRGKSIAKAWDLLVFVPAGLGGLILFYISVLSEHQFVTPNYNLWVLQPLHLLVLLFTLLGQWGLRGLMCYHFANFVAISAFVLVAFFLPQHFNVALYPISVSLALVSLARLVAIRRANK